MMGSPGFLRRGGGERACQRGSAKGCHCFLLLLYLIQSCVHGESVLERETMSVIINRQWNPVEWHTYLNCSLHCSCHTTDTVDATRLAPCAAPTLLADAAVLLTLVHNGS